MSDFGSISKEEHEEWLRMPATSKAIADLRELHALTCDALISGAEQGDSHDNIRFSAGFAAGIKQAIHHMTRERK